ncbi:hypothetical protein BDA99DRAFT_240597 [Phascolomyces articulosus]|uniref:Uncharacterized protein n=1 Tax=Phascolomyces articulosus TaxID=60185 RepID=A0AAD5K8M4_9FUNG|nr:hypothetical protein BDA99DRAFT_240597 [Phascolomyces articulosus]
MIMYKIYFYTHFRLFFYICFYVHVEFSKPILLHVVLKLIKQLVFLSTYHLFLL